MNMMELELRIRQLVADELGVGMEELRREVPLTDDLATDSPDLLELVLAPEADCGIAVPERSLEDARPYDHLVDAVLGLRNGNRRNGLPAGSAPLRVRSCIEKAGAAPASTLQRTGILTPYLAATIADDAVRAGRGSRLEVTVPESAGDTDVAWVERRFARLRERGLEVNVRRDRQTPLSPWGRGAAA